MEESKFKKILFNEFSFILTIISLVVGVTLFITNSSGEVNDKVIILQEKMDKIERNDLPHLDAKLQVLQQSVDDTRLDIRELKTILQFKK